MNWAPKSQLGTWEVAHVVDGVREMEGEGFLRIKMQGQNGMHNTKLRIFLAVLQILEVFQELIRGVRRSTSKTNR